MTDEKLNSERGPDAENSDETTDSVESEEKSSISPGEVFNPEEELEKIRIAPKKEKREMLEDYKKNLAYQKEGLAYMQVELLDVIMGNPDVDIDKLDEVREEYSSWYRLTKEQNLTTFRAEQKYIENHKAIKDVMEWYHDDKDNTQIFKDMFGREPLGKIELIQGPMTIYLRIHNFDDYTFVYSGGYFQKDNKTQKEILERSFSTMGAKLDSDFADKKFDKIKGVVIIENARGKEFGKKEKIVFVHEQRHVINELLDKHEGITFNLQKAKEATTANEQNIELKRGFRYVRGVYEALAKDEILAYLEDGSDGEDIKKDLTALKEQEGVYDYFSIKKEELINYSVKHLGEEKRDLIEQTTEDVFVKEYRKLINDGVDTFTKLREEGYSKEEAIALLHHEPFSKWGKLLRRLPINGEIPMPKTKQEKHEE